MPSSSTKQWWKRATAALKDKRSVYLIRLAGGARGHQSEMETAVILATSHDDRSINYKNASLVFAWARASPTPLLRSLTRRATRTRSWPVALKTLLLVHGLLLSSSPPLGRLPFDLSDFRDPSPGFSAFVRAYFQFLDHRSVLSTSNDVEMLVRMQDLLDLLMQIRPYEDGMEVGLIVEAMNCVVIEIFEVYGGICRGIAGFLVERRVGMEGIRVLRRAGEQREQVLCFFGMCRSIGVLNAVEIPVVEAVAEEDMEELEGLVAGEGDFGKGKEEEWRWETVVTEEWELFEDNLI